MYKQSGFKSRQPTQSSTKKTVSSHPTPITTTTSSSTNRNFRTGANRNPNNWRSSTNRPPSQSQMRQKTSLDRFQKQQATQATSCSSRVSPYRRAPANQFRRYLSDSQNVFWENSPQVRQLKIFSYLKMCLLSLFLILVSSYVLIGRISPWPAGECPDHAECGVFVHCKKGYVLDSHRCIIDPQLRQRAQTICLAVVEQLKLDYGNSECHHGEALGSGAAKIPEKRIKDILMEFDISDPLLAEGIYQYFERVDNQSHNQFRSEGISVFPTEKMYSVSCSVELFVASRHFYWVLALLLLSSVAGGSLLRWLIFRWKARLGYEYLRGKLLHQESVMVEEQKEALIGIAGQWTDALWKEIDRLRCEQRRIVYFSEHEQLYWKWFKQF